ncbi:hypothetical protein QQY66_13805 [Streptomyces sp. DG2A-72]|uniref:hypothetical protein n=1 Tax=Streptomyces sp. DG2A-72 TaxID=3051386 RepID=UPI00265B845B|nr:hypothetical protein [Streptomyces sp. DG2A-72]MDO0932714.1 hypothetical protein [Streptomyces sp. DG2A-72]
MGVIDSQWWSMRWPWMVVWLLTAVCFAVVVQYVLARWIARRRVRRRGGGTVSGLCIYLHETRVEGVADYLGIPKADMNVSQETSVSTGFGVFSKFTVGGGNAKRDTSTATRTEYWEPNTPMKTIRLIMDRLRERDMVVDADLTTGKLVPTATLANELRGTDDEHSAPLSAVRPPAYVSVSGMFTVRRVDGDQVVLRARYGNLMPPAHVKITCEESWVREEFGVDSYAEDEEFAATCLGRVRTWNAATRVLTLNPVSIFQ